MTCEEAMNTIRKAMSEDFGYAWAWHCNIAVAAQDEGMEHEASNRAAARFMRLAFGIDTSDEAADKALRQQQAELLNDAVRG